MRNRRGIVALVALLATAGCSSDPRQTGEREETGSLLLQLELANGESVDQVEYVITRGGMEPMDGLIDTSAPGATASVEVFGLEPGDGYRITMTAEASDESTRCTGATDFSVAAGTATEIMVVLKCKGPPRFGAVRANGKLNICAELTKMVAAPLQTSVGSTVDLSAAGLDAEGDPFAIRWTADGADLDTTDGAENVLTCVREGDASVTVEVSDDDFDYCVSGWTIAITCVDDGGGTGGSGGGAGAGGEGGMGGEAGAGGAGGEAGSGGAGGEGGMGGDPGTPALAALPTAPRFAVVSTDFFTGSSIAVLDDDFTILDENWIDSSTTFPGQLATLGTDVVLPTRQADDGTVAWIDRFQTDVVSRFFVPSGNLNGQLRTQSVDPSVFSSNPRDFIVVNENSAWVSRFEQNPDSTAQPADQGNDLVEVDPTTMVLTGKRIDLSSLNTEVGGTEVIARPDRGVLVGSTLVVGLARLSEDFVSAAGPGMVAVVDLVDDSVEGVLLGSGLENCGSLSPVPGAETKVVVSCVGFPFGNRESAGVLLLDVAAGVVTVETTWRAADDPSSAVAVQNLVPINESSVVAVETDLVTFTDPDALYLLNIGTGSQELVYQSQGAFQIGRSAYDPADDRLYVPDSGANVVVEFTVEATGATEIGSIPIAPETGLPPNAVYLLATGGGGEACVAPSPPVLGAIHAGATLSFDAMTEVGTSSDLEATEPDTWTVTDQYTFPTEGTPTSIKVFARSVGASCQFEQVYEVVDQYAPAPPAPDPGDRGDSDAINQADPAIVGWATGFVEPVDYGTDVDETWRTPELALGPAMGTSTDIVALGRGGSIVMTFTPAITNGDGVDFAVFENGFSDTFLELGFVEVSSNGVDFARFATSYLGPMELIGAFGSLDPTDLQGIASKYQQGEGTPYDLEWLRFDPLVQEGDLDLSAITHVRIVDIIGSGDTTDSFGNEIYDPFPTTGSAGFDLEAIGVVNQAN